MVERKNVDKRDSRCILIDTREKTPWIFHAQKKEMLKHGDYSILRGKTKIVIERKTLVDLYITFSPPRWEKFFNKMVLAKETLDHVFIFVEASLSEVYHGIPHSRLSAPYIIKRIIALMEIGIPVIFTGNTKRGPQFAEALLRELG